MILKAKHSKVYLAKMKLAEAGQLGLIPITRAKRPQAF